MDLLPGQRLANRLAIVGVSGARGMVVKGAVGREVGSFNVDSARGHSRGIKPEAVVLLSVVLVGRVWRIVAASASRNSSPERLKTPGRPSCQASVYATFSL